MLRYWPPCLKEENKLSQGFLTLYEKLEEPSIEQEVPEWRRDHLGRPVAGIN